MSAVKCLWVFGGALLWSSLAVDAFACDDINLNVTSIKKCKDVEQQVITVFDNMTLRVSDSCEILVNSCTFFTPYKMAKLELSFYKGKSRLFKEKYDFCASDKKMKEMAQLLIGAFGIIPGCPVASNKTVGCNKERLLRVLSLMGQNSIRTLFGGVSEPIKIVIDIEHDSGRTCFDALIAYSGIPKRG